MKNTAAYYLTMGPKKGRRVRKIEVPTDSVPEFELLDTAADIQQRRQDREARERDEVQQQQQREQKARKEEARAEESHSQEEGQKKRPRTQRSETETEAGGGEVGKSQSHNKKGHMTNVYLTSDEEAIVDFVKDHELYDKTSDHFKDKVKKKSLWEEFARSHKRSVKVCKTWFRKGHITGC